MRKVSEILKLAIDSGYYCEGSFMYHSVAKLFDNKKITLKERDATVSRIEKQMKTMFTKRKNAGMMPHWCLSREPSAMSSFFTHSAEGSTKATMKYYKKWIRDLRSRGN